MHLVGVLKAEKGSKKGIKAESKIIVLEMAQQQYAQAQSAQVASMCRTQATAFV